MVCQIEIMNKAKVAGYLMQFLDRDSNPKVHQLNKTNHHMLKVALNDRIHLSNKITLIRKIKTLMISTLGTKQIQSINQKIHIKNRVV